ncbi:beta-lactamase-like protein [Pseudoneurospora amorphoporcata]|uniref:Beta-lactamase-like protein n=1 Tax=Pseudoneurospora amorphoporcata TaxID=241081 RepID=A0AAN6SD87_9PEZI|nr:beta-lactamase-like protein [Pseudoneurospora amorphoporcata]
MAPTPNLNIPPSPATVSVSIINSTGTLHGVPAKSFVAPPQPGHDWLAVPMFAFLIQHPSTGRSLMFDLGMRKDIQNMPPALLRHFPEIGWTLSAEKNVADILQENNFDVSKIEAVVWSHYHFDHTGDITTIGPQAALIVGPGFKKGLLPGYPANPDAPILEADYKDRELIEVDFTSAASDGKDWKRLTIGRFPAVDYFGDGSFYLLDAPGHAIGHMCSLARVTSQQNDGYDSFVCLGGDAVHHVGEIRPSQFKPLPEEISPNPFLPLSAKNTCESKCPGAALQKLLPKPELPTRSFYEAARGEAWHHDVEQTIDTAGKLQEPDALDNVFVAIAHDESLLDVVDFYPHGTMNEFVKKGWVQKGHWRFLRDFRDGLTSKEDKGGVETVEWPHNRTWGRVEKKAA